jgi:flagella basal body P-ring formation protein FlgA
LNDGYYLNDKNIAGREAKFFIAAGSALTKANTERKRIINFGDTVNIIYKSSGLILKTKGMALQAGALNSVIRVKNIQSGTVLNCLVKSDKAVAVR